MPSYETGITEINTQVRRLGYVSGLLTILGSRTLSELLLLERLQTWSVKHEDALRTYPYRQGQIKPTRQMTGAKRYTELALSLGLVGKIAGAYRVTRFGRSLLPFLGSNTFALSLIEKVSYLYWLVIRDEDRLLTVLEMLTEKPEQSLALLQRNFQDRYVRRLTARTATVDERIAREMLVVRNRVTREWKSPERYAENIVPPRINWLADLGLACIAEGVRGRPVQLTLQGSQFLDALPTAVGSNIHQAGTAWCRNTFFSAAAPILSGQHGCNWSDLPANERHDLLDDLTPRAFAILRTSPAPKVSLYPSLMYIALVLASENVVWANIEELQRDLDTYGREASSRYEVRFSHRENEAYLIAKLRLQ